MNHENIEWLANYLCTDVKKQKSFLMMKQPYPFLSFGQFLKLNCLIKIVAKNP